MFDKFENIENLDTHFRGEDKGNQPESEVRLVSTSMNEPKKVFIDYNKAIVL